MASGKITISDVAREAGVSIATVSRVIQGKASVSPDLAQRVREVARRFGYRPSPLARGLATGATEMVGILVPQLSNPYFQELIKAIGLGAGHDGYRMLVLETDERVGDEPDLAASLYTHVDGVILCSPRMPDDELTRFAAAHPKVVCINRVLSGWRLPGVACDYFSPMLDLCRHLADLGHHRVVYLHGSPYSWATAERWRAVQAAAALGMEPFRVEGGLTIEAGYDAVGAALAFDPTALIAVNDLCAIGALTRLRELGRRVPEDISLTGFDDIPFSAHTQPPLTTARIPRAAMAEDVWAMMRAVLAGETITSRVFTTAEILVRGTTGPAPGRAAPVAAR